MDASEQKKSPSRRRPRSKGFLRLDLKNAYAELGVSPLASLQEINARYAELRGKAAKKAKFKAQKGTSEEEEEIIRLDEINKEIGKEKSRKDYDEKNPQNILLTVQPSPAEQAWVRHRKAGLISEWLYDELGEQAFLPSLRCLGLWLPSGLDDETAAYLTRYIRSTDVQSAAPEQAVLGGDDGLSIHVSLDDLERLTKHDS